MAGSPNLSRRRPMFVRLQLNRDGRMSNYSAAADVDERELLDRAPDLDVAGNRVRLEGRQYRMTLALHDESRSPQSPVSSPRFPVPSPHDVNGEITLDAAPGRSLPPAAIHGARGWISGYV